MKKKIKIILASASPRRRELLSPFYRLKVVPAHLHERRKSGESAQYFVKRVSLDKWKAISKRSTFENDIIVAADTIVIMSGKILGKPSSKKSAWKMLSSLSGKSHWVVSSVVVGRRQKFRQATVKTKVKFRKLSVDEIKNYLKSGEWRDKAGAYAIQGQAAYFVKEIQGSLTAVIGLPLSETLNLLRSLSTSKRRSRN